MVCRLLALMMCVIALMGCNAPVAGVYPAIGEPSDKVVYLTSNHWHAGFVLGMEDLPVGHQKELKPFEGYRFIEVGWGSDLFYRAKTPTVWTGVCAAFFSPRGVMHMVGVGPEVESNYARHRGELYRIRLSRPGYDALVKYVFDSLERDGSGGLIEVEPGLYGFSRFYRAKGYYSILHTCNHWAADGLREAGLPVTPVYAFTADNLCMQVRQGCIKHQEDVVVFQR